MILTINGKEYTLEYNFEASLCEECVQSVIGFFNALATSSEELLNTTVSTVPKTVITMFYAGLLEHHPEITKAEAKSLLKQYFKENPDADNGNFQGMFTFIYDQMAIDGFFKQIGLESLLQQAAQTETPEAKTPQDRKKKSTGKK